MRSAAEPRNEVEIEILSDIGRKRRHTKTINGVPALPLVTPYKNINKLCNANVKRSKGRENTEQASILTLQVKGIHAFSDSLAKFVGPLDGSVFFQSVIQVIEKIHDVFELGMVQGNIKHFQGFFRPTHD